MKRKIFCFCTMALLLLGLTACGGGKEEKTVDVGALAQELTEKLTFDAPLSPVTAEDLANYGVHVPEGAALAAYMSGGTTAEEIVAVQCPSREEADTLKAQLETLLADQRTEMGRYLPAESARLEQAVLVQKGGCVVLCVAGEADTATEIIKGYLG